VTLVSVGYGGHASADAFSDQLLATGTTLLVDVRLNPISRKPGFSKKQLTAALAEVGIEYLHERALGNPQDNRDAFARGDPAARERMRQIVRRSDALERLVDRARHERVAVMCLCAEQSKCHRDVIIEEALRLDPTLEVVPM